MEHFNKVTKLTILLLFFVLSTYAIIAVRNFLYPLSLAIIFSYLLYGPAAFLEKKRVPRILSNLIVIITSLFVVFLTGKILYEQLSVFLEDLPQLKDQAVKNVRKLEKDLESYFGMETESGWLQNKVSEFIEISGDFLKNVLSATTDTLVKVLLIPIYIFFLLYYRNKFEAFLFNVTHKENHQRLKSVLSEIIYMMKRYVSGIVIVILILSVINSAGLTIIGLKYAILLGILSALMNFIPYFGTLIGGLIPFTFALLTEDSFSKASGVIILFLIVQFLENNILTPSITGGQVKINPFFTILSIIAGGMIWGVPGMIVAVPFIGGLKILCDHISYLIPYSFLIGKSGTEEYALNWKNIKSRLGIKK